jgi:hypothetical protein
LLVKGEKCNKNMAARLPFGQRVAGAAEAMWRVRSSLRFGEQSDSLASAPAHEKRNTRRERALFAASALRGILFKTRNYIYEMNVNK